ncbi:MAG: hypothetical protein LUF00_01075 [Lachnospiraceae bacterium]|nr:hypothetical protein [Lachnospiraceae bacterium]
MSKLTVSYQKTLKLTNPCLREITEADLPHLDRILFQMENYIKSKGAMPLGPLIERSRITVNEQGEADIRIQLIRQVNQYIWNIEAPYTMQPLLRCPNCLFVRFHGEEHQLKFAYDKLNLISFEEEIPLTGLTYTVFTSKNEEDFTADVFMERADAVNAGKAASGRPDS